MVKLSNENDHCKVTNQTPWFQFLGKKKKPWFRFQNISTNKTRKSTLIL